MLCYLEGIPMSQLLQDLAFRVVNVYVAHDLAIDMSFSLCWHYGLERARQGSGGRL